MSIGFIGENVPARPKEVVLVSRVEGNLIVIAGGGKRQIRRLHNMDKSLRDALASNKTVSCWAKLNRDGRWSITEILT